MDSETKDQLLRRITLLERSTILNNKDYSSNKEKFDNIFSKVKDLIDAEEIRNYLEVDSTFQYLIEKIKESGSDIDQSAKEIKNFIS